MTDTIDEKPVRIKYSPDIRLDNMLVGAIYLITLGSIYGLQKAHNTQTDREIVTLQTAHREMQETDRDQTKNIGQMDTSIKLLARDVESINGTVKEIRAEQKMTTEEIRRISRTVNAPN